MPLTFEQIDQGAKEGVLDFINALGMKTGRIVRCRVCRKMFEEKKVSAGVELCSDKCSLSSI